jgi:multidrug resistance efflux pump
MENIELRSQEVREILTKIPQSIVRWGISVIAFIWISILVGSIIFRYPDMISGEAIITTENAPIWLASKVSGSIQEIYVKHLQQVENGELLAVMENTAKTEDVMYLKQITADSLFSKLDNLMNNPKLVEKQLTLGDIQSSWSNLMNQYSEYDSFLRIDLFSTQKTSLTDELKVRHESILTLKRQEENQKQVYKLVQTRFKREQELFRKGVISPDDFQKSEEVVLSSKQTLENIRYSINTAQMEYLRLKQSLTNTEIEHAKTINDLQNRFKVSLKELTAAIKTWELNYILRSPTSGIVSFPENRNPHDQIKVGDRVFAIVSGQPGNLIAQLKLAASGAGKIRKGQSVQIQIDGYPYMEYGMIEGKIISTSLISNMDHNYSVKVSLPKKLITTYHKKIEFRGELTGMAQIRTQDMRLIQRILNPIRHVFSTYN